SGSPTPTCRSGSGGSRTTWRRASGCERSPDPTRGRVGARGFELASRSPRAPRDAMIPRYVLPEMAAVWSEDARLGHWLEIEILVAEALAGLGVVPDADAREIRASASFDAERVAEVERVTRHDVAAFVQVVGESVGTAGRWVHFGLTSSDVLDTGLALQLRDASDLLLERLERLLAVAKRMALANRDVVMAGRTHGVVAEPTSFGHKVGLWAFELDRDRDRLRRARETVSVGAISGVVGTYAQVDPRVEEEVCAKLGLRAAEA